EGFLKLIKGAKEMLHKNMLIKARVKELKEQLAEITKRKGYKRKRIQTGGTMEYGTAALYVAAKVSGASNPRKKVGSRDGANRALPAQRRCGNCGEAGHNARTCKKD
ncbi:uncharacterized protein BDZ99DRAFT_392654, partial [Mytilinidion resinicola]